METPWEKIGQYRFPIQYWTNKLVSYFELIDETRNLEKPPKVIKILKTQVKYQLENDQTIYCISKNKLSKREKHDPAKRISANIVYFRHKIDFIINDKTFKAEIWVEVTSTKIVKEAIDLLYIGNPHWQMNILSEDQLKKNIHDVLNFNIGRFCYVKS